MKNKVYSFDIFDTCITRTYSNPRDLFNEVAVRVLIKSYPEYTREDVEKIAKFRIDAEKQARSSCKDEDTTLKSIYRNFRSLSQWNINLEELMHEELMMEERCIRPINCTLNFILRLREKGHRIIFISDMYLPTEFIQDRLIEHRFYDKKDAIYVSGDIGLVKWTGSLFKYVLDKEKLSPQELYHHGDNIRSDVSIPSRYGINSFLFKEISPNRYEQKILTKSYLQTEKLSNIAGISRVKRLAYDIENERQKELVQLVANVVSPLLIAFVSWVIKDAIKNGFDRLYFVSRDGQILYKIAQKLSEYIDVPECRYLLGSRQAWYLPSLINQDGSLDFNSITNPNKSRTPRDILSRICIVPEMVSSELDKFYFNFDLDQQLSEKNLTIFHEFLKTPKVYKLINRKAREARKISLEYFDQEGLLSKIKWSCVDVGWRLTSQRALKRILDSHVPQAQLHGYYLAVAKDRVSLSESGPYRSFIEHDLLNSLLGGKSYNWFLKKSAVHIVESFFLMANHPTVIKYKRCNSSINPVYGENDNSTQARMTVDILHSSILDYVEEIARTDLIDNHFDIFAETAFETATQFFLYPKRADVLPLSELVVYNEHTYEKRWEERLTRELKISDLIRMVGEGLSMGKPVEQGKLRQLPVWLEGSAAISSPAIQVIFSLLKQGKEMYTNSKLGTYFDQIHD